MKKAKLIGVYIECWLCVLALGGLPLDDLMKDECIDYLIIL